MLYWSLPLDNYLARRYAVFISLDIKSLTFFCTHGAKADVAVRVPRVVVVAVRALQVGGCVVPATAAIHTIRTVMIIAQRRFFYADGMYSTILDLPCSSVGSALNASHRSGR